MKKNVYNIISRNKFKIELIKYKKSLIEMKRECAKFNLKAINKPNIKINDNFKEEIWNDTNDNLDILGLSEIADFEKSPLITFSEEKSIDFEPDLFYRECYLYHGIRLYNQLEKLEGIFKERKILAGKYLENFYNFRDNCNDGEYVSLASFSDSLEFTTFVKKNISLIISPFCNAYKTMYVSSELWDRIKESNVSLKQRYSYARSEYQVKDYIPLEMVKAIGIPYFDAMMSQGINRADSLKENIIELLERYEIDLPIVDISCYNDIIYSKSKKH